MPPTVPFDYMRRLEQRGRPAETVDPIGATIDAMQREEVERSVFDNPVPDRVARVTRLARDAGETTLNVEGREDEIETALRAQSFASFLANSTAMSRWAAANPRGAAAASDDTDALGLLASGFENIIHRTGAGILDSVAGLLEPIPGMPSPETLLTPFWANNPYARAREAIQTPLHEAAARQRDQGRADNWFAEAALSGVESIPIAAAAALTRNPTLATAIPAASVFGNSRAEARRQGLSESQALTYGVAQGGIEYATERLPMGTLVEAIVKRTPFGKAVVRQLATEIPGEQLATATQDLVDWAMLPENEGKTFGDYLAERPSAALQTAVATVSGTAGQTALAKGVQASVDAGVRVADRVGAARQARAERQAIDRLAQGAEGSKLRQRDPETFRELVRQQAEEAGAGEVFVPGEAIRAYQQSDDYRASDDPFASYDVADAAASGGDVVVPIENFLTDIVGTKAWEAVREDVRLTAGGMSSREAQSFEEAMDDVMAEMSDRAATQDRAGQESRTVREKIVDRLAEQFGTSFTAPVARQYAELAAQRMQTRAAVLGRELSESDLDGFEVRQVLPEGVAEAVKADQLDLVINALRQGKPVESGVGPSLLQFIGERGGINDAGGDLAAMGLPAKFLRDFDLRQTEMTGGLSGAGDFGLDTTLRAAIEAGFFPDLANVENEAGPSQLDTQRLLDALAEEAAGRPVHAQTREDPMRAAAEDLRAMLEGSGLNPDRMNDAEIREAVDGMVSQQAEGRNYQQAVRSPIADEVDAAWDGQRTFGNIGLGQVPAVLKRFGFKGVLSINRGKLHKIAGDHAVAREIIYGLPELLADPWAVFPSSDQRRADAVVVALRARDANDDPVIAIVDRNGGVSFVSSVYGKRGRGDATGEDWIARQVANAKSAGKKVFEKGGPPERSAEPISGISPARPRKPILSLPSKGKVGLDQSDMSNDPRGRIEFDGARRTIKLFQSRNLSTPLHELSHMWLEELAADASLPDAPAQLKADWETAKRYFATNGHKIGKDGAIPTEAHELWARSGERYLMEGKAPSSALTRLFEQFRAWLVGIYKTVDRLRAPISPEIREVFDRLLATDEEIAAAQERQGLAALFKDAAEAGMSEAEFGAYQRQVDDARAGAHASLLDKTMRSVRHRANRQYSEARKKVRAEEQERIDGSPLYKALAAMKENRVSREWIVDEMGEDTLGLLPARVPPLYVDGGAHPDAIAEQAGYASGRDMLDNVLGAERAHRAAKDAGDTRSMRERAIETATDAEMQRRWGDPLNDGSIEREALAAVHGEMQGEVFAAELRTLSRKTGTRPTPYRIAREWARGKVRGGTVAQEASPSAIQRHARNVAKAGRAAEQALAKGDFEEAFRQKQFQMLSSAQLAEAKLANDEVAAAAKRMDKTARTKTRTSIDQDYLEQAQALLEEVDLKPRSQISIERQGKWAQWAESREAEGYDVVVPASFEATINRTHWTRLSVETLLALDEAVKQVLHLGRLKQTLLDNKEEREWSEVYREAAHSAGNIKGPPPADVMEPGFWGSMKSRVMGADAALLKMETVFDWLDGGDSNGVFNRVAFRPVAEAQAREQDMLKDYYARIKDLFEAIPTKEAERLQDKVRTPFMWEGRPLVLRRQQVIAMALNVGNAGNLERLAGGYGLNQEAVVDYLANELSAAEWQFVQGVWDVVETLWPEIEALERRVNGVAPEKVEAKEVVTPHGTFRGGYYPAIYNSRLSYQAGQHAAELENSLLEPRATRATTRSAATKERAEGVKRPILLDLGVINRHLGEVIHDVTHREAVMRAWKFLNEPAVMRAVDEALGPEIRESFRPWVKFVANSWAMERAGNEGFGAWIGKLRANATAVGLGLRATTMVTQLAGYSNSVEVVGEKWLVEAVTQISAHPIATFRFVMERSDEMRHRMNTIDRDIRTEIARISAKTVPGKAMTRLDEARVFMFHGIGLMDRAVSVPTWIAGYNKALAAGMSEADAAYAGDKAVRQSQGAGGPKDLAAIQRGTGKWGEALKLFTMFYSFFSAQYQRQRTLARDVAGKDARRPRSMPRLASRAFFMLVLPPLLVEVLKMPLGAGGPDDDEWWAQWTLRKLLANALGPIPLARDVFEPAWNAAIKGRFYNPSISPIQRAYDSVVKTAGDTGKVARGEETKHMTKDVLELAGYATGLVPGQLAAATQFLVDVGSGDADPEGFSDWLEGLSRGKPADE